MKHLKNVAVIFGGCSPEYEVSLESAFAVLENMDREKYNPVCIGISRQGDWFYFTGDIMKIKEDRWQEAGECLPACLSQSRCDRCLYVFEESNIVKLPLDGAFPVLHGKNGEDGTVQGLIELAGIPLVGCGVLASALCMDKDRAHRLAAAAGVAVPRTFAVEKSTPKQAVVAFGEGTGYPLFVKPVRAGSSFGVSKVSDREALLKAVEQAFSYDDRVLVEEAVEGFEVGCAVMGRDRLKTGEVDEIELSGGFFDYTEKYTLKTSAIYVPARISPGKSHEIKETAKRIYKALDCKGFARVDMFLTPQGRIVFNEVNTIPGFTQHSRFPGMMKAAGLSFKEMLDQILEEAVET